MSRHVFAFKIGVNPRTLERWEQGRSKPNEQAAAFESGWYGSTLTHSRGWSRSRPQLESRLRLWLRIGPRRTSVVTSQLVRDGFDFLGRHMA